MARPHAWLAWAALVGAVAGPGPAAAQMYQLYLDCKGQISAGKKSHDAEIALALRDNNMSALVQRSNVLPVGETMAYTASQTHYTAVYTTPVRTGTVYTNWYHSWIFVWYPDFQYLVTTRLSIDRQTADLKGEMLNDRGAVLGRMTMSCVPKSEADAPAPKF